MLETMHLLTLEIVKVNKPLNVSMCIRVYESRENEATRAQWKIVCCLLK